jgi:hypothetical protein
MTNRGPSAMSVQVPQSAHGQFVASRWSEIARSAMVNCLSQLRNQGSAAGSQAVRADSGPARIAHASRLRRPEHGQELCGPRTGRFRPKETYRAEGAGSINQVGAGRDSRHQTIGFHAGLPASVSSRQWSGSLYPGRIDHPAAKVVCWAEKMAAEGEKLVGLRLSRKRCRFEEMANPLEKIAEGTVGLPRQALRLRKAGK